MDHVPKIVETITHTRKNTLQENIHLLFLNPHRSIRRIPPKNLLVIIVVVADPQSVQRFPTTTRRRRQDTQRHEPIDALPRRTQPNPHLPHTDHNKHKHEHHHHGAPRIRSPQFHPRRPGPSRRGDGVRPEAVRPVPRGGSGLREPPDRERGPHKQERELPRPLPRDRCDGDHGGRDGEAVRFHPQIHAGGARRHPRGGGLRVQLSEGAGVVAGRLAAASAALAAVAERRTGTRFRRPPRSFRRERRPRTPSFGWFEMDSGGVWTENNWAAGKWFHLTLHLGARAVDSTVRSRNRSLSRNLNV